MTFSASGDQCAWDASCASHDYGVRCDSEDDGTGTSLCDCERDGAHAGTFLVEGEGAAACVAGIEACKVS